MTVKKTSYLFGKNSVDAFQKMKQAEGARTNFTIGNLESIEAQLQAVAQLYSSIERARQVDERIAVTPVSV